MTNNSAKLEMALRRAEGLANICNDLHARLATMTAERDKLRKRLAELEMEVKPDARSS